MPEKQTKEEKDTRGLQKRAKANAFWGWIWSLLNEHLGERVLEAGCGNADLAPKIVRKGAYYLGVDRSAPVIEHNQGSEQFDHPLIHFEKGDVTAEEFTKLISEHKIDTILAHNVVEHLEEPDRFLSSCYEALPVGGRIILVVPAVPSLFGLPDEAAGHQQRFDKPSLRDVFERNQFRVKKLRYMNLPGLLPLYYRNRLNPSPEGYFESKSDFSITLHNLIIPVVQLLEGALPPPIGVSLIGVAEK